MIITAKALKDIGACRYGLKKFRRHFGKGGEVTLERARLWHHLGEGYAKAVWLMHIDARRQYDKEAYGTYGSYDMRPVRFMRAVELHDKIMRQMG